MIATLFAVNLHFGLYVLGALILFSIGWLYLDSWKNTHKNGFTFFYILGYILLAIGWLGKAVQNTTPVINATVEIVNILGLNIILSGLIIEPLLKPPSQKKVLKISLVIPVALLGWIFIPPKILLLAAITILYLIKINRGYQKQLKFAAIGFFLLTIASILELQEPLVKISNNVVLEQLLTNYGIFWYLHKIFLFLGITSLIAWSWSYLRFRFQSQLFLSLTSVVVVIFLTTTTGFTWLLLRNLETTILSGLKTNIHVFEYALEKNQLEQLAINKSIAANSQLPAAINNELTPNQISELTSQLMLNNQASFLHLINSNGEVVHRVENESRSGDSVADEPMIKKALAGYSQSAIRIDHSLMTPQLLIEAASPIFDIDGKNVIGVVSSGFSIDNAFVDGIKAVTNLETTVFADKQRIATTITAEDGITRYLGTNESNGEILNQVLDQGNYFLGSTKIINIPYYVAYAPLKDLNSQPIGMLAVGSLQTNLENLTAESIRLTFAVSAGLIVISVAPIYFFSRKIEEYLVT
ncbi:MAG: cache domain-containing protein [Patescibacteria group bacterium]